LSNADRTCQDEWLHELASCFQKIFPKEQISINEPFKGGYIIRNYSAKHAWLQIELSRKENISSSDKRDGVIEALNAWYRKIF
jgi:N-formylglutamate amidohydrolase